MIGSSQSSASKKQLNATNALGNQAQSTANSLYGEINPILSKEATNPTGFSAGDLGNMTTASNEALGGAEAGAVGQGNLEAARTRNTGGYSAALDESARTAGRTASTNALGIQNANANLKEQQRQAGIAGLGNLYGTNVNETESLYGMGPSTLQAGKQPGWFQQMTGALGGLGQGVGSAMYGYGNL